MNAPETMKPATQPISPAHKVLLKADGALCAEETKAGDSEGGETDAPAAINDTPKFGHGLSCGACHDGCAGEQCKVERDSPQVDWSMTPELQYLAPEDYKMPPADPVLLASANKMLCERMEAIAEQLRAGTIPELENVTGAEDLAPHVKTLCDALAAAESVVTARGHTINGYRLEVADLRERLDAQIKQWQADTGMLTEKNARLATDLEEMTSERDLMKAENLALKTLESSMPGFGAEHQERRINSLTTDVINTRNALTNAINEADRLRAELAAERRAREALQEKGSATDVTAAAVGYLVRAPKRPPMIRRKPEAARLAALGAVRAGAARAEVLAVVPVGTARRGAEWQPTEAGD